MTTLLVLRLILLFVVGTSILVTEETLLVGTHRLKKYQQPYFAVRYQDYKVMLCRVRLFVFRGIYAGITRTRGSSGNSVQHHTLSDKLCELC